MKHQLKGLQNWFDGNARLIQGAAAPMLVVAILSMMVLPLPSWMLDAFFTINIAVALMVMMVAAYMLRPLDFAAFPAVLLLTTLMRLSLNVASTRVVLLDGHTGPGAAGAVIEAFGHFLIGGNLFHFGCHKFCGRHKGCRAYRRSVGPLCAGCDARQANGSRCRLECGSD